MSGTWGSGEAGRARRFASLGLEERPQFLWILCIFSLTRQPVFHVERSMLTIFTDQVDQLSPAPLGENLMFLNRELYRPSRCVLSTAVGPPSLGGAAGLGPPSLAASEGLLCQDGREC